MAWPVASDARDSRRYSRRASHSVLQVSPPKDIRWATEESSLGIPVLLRGFLFVSHWKQEAILVTDSRSWAPDIMTKAVWTWPGPSWSWYRSRWSVAHTILLSTARIFVVPTIPSLLWQLVSVYTRDRSPVFARYFQGAAQSGPC